MLQYSRILPNCKEGLVLKKLVVSVWSFILALLLSVSSVSNTHAATNFKDVPEGYWAKKEIEYLVQEGIIKGYDDGTFKPEKPVTRLQAATMLVRALGLDTNNRPDPGFKDIREGDYGYEYVAAVVDEGIFSKAQTFNPNKPLTRGQMAKILVKAFRLQGDYQGEIKDVSKEFESYVRVLAANGITKLYNDNTYKPNEVVKRAHFAVFFARVKDPQFRVENQEGSQDEVLYEGKLYNTLKEMKGKTFFADAYGGTFYFGIITDEKEMILPRENEKEIHIWLGYQSASWGDDLWEGRVKIHSDDSGVFDYKYYWDEEERVFTDGKIKLEGNVLIISYKNEGEEYTISFPLNQNWSNE
jgi:S-layer homology domain